MKNIKYTTSTLLLLLSLAPLSLTGCATGNATTSVPTAAGPVAVPTTVLNTSNTIANVLQTMNNALMPANVNAVLTQTHNTGDAGIAADGILGLNLATALVTQFNATLQASQTAGATTAQTQAAISANVLSPANVAATTANVMVTTTPVAATTGAGQ